MGGGGGQCSCSARGQDSQHEIECPGVLKVSRHFNIVRSRFFSSGFFQKVFHKFRGSRTLGIGGPGG